MGIVREDEVAVKSLARGIDTAIAGVTGVPCRGACLGRHRGVREIIGGVGAMASRSGNGRGLGW